MAAVSGFSARPCVSDRSTVTGTSSPHGVLVGLRAGSAWALRRPVVIRLSLTLPHAELDPSGPFPRTSRMLGQGGSPAAEQRHRRRLVRRGEAVLAAERVVRRHDPTGSGGAPRWRAGPRTLATAAATPGRTVTGAATGWVCFPLSPAPSAKARSLCRRPAGLLASETRRRTAYFRWTALSPWASSTRSGRFSGAAAASGASPRAAATHQHRKVSPPLLRSGRHAGWP
jgi:hypothetical protein